MPNNKNSNYRPKVPPDIKLELYLEAGNKCANPGCPNAMVEFHHIQEWHIYQTHDQAHMIAVCPACHSHAHYGKLKIDDLTIRHWKSITRPVSNRGHIYVEPGDSCRVLLGCIYMTNGSASPEGITVFRLSHRNQLSFRIADGDILLTNLTVTNVAGYELVRVVDGHLKHNVGEPVQYESRVGKHRLTAPATSEYVPEWVLEKYSQNPPTPMVEDGRITILDIEVLDRGLVQVQGVWAEDGRAVVITRDWLSLCLTRTGGFVHIRGYGEVRGDKDLNKLPVLRYEGPIEYSILSAALNTSEL